MISGIHGPPTAVAQGLPLNLPYLMQEWCPYNVVFRVCLVITVVLKLMER